MGTARLARRRGGPHVHTEPADEPAQRTVEDVIFFHAFDFFAARARRERRGRCRHGRMIATPLSYGNTVDSVYRQDIGAPTRQTPGCWGTKRSFRAADSSVNFLT